uniref:Pentatricopeptide repeat-containing protein n=1 Tax=Kalanchoe fedtschenkoi TaxID=63787 RepID=A0A7N0U0R2_KALFE
MMSEKVEFDEFTMMSVVVKTCTEPGDLSCGMQIHCCAEKLCFWSGTDIGNSLVTMYTRCEQRSKAALKVFQEIRTPNVISWTGIIAGLTQDGQNVQATDLYKRMVTSGLNENQFTFASIIPAIGHSANFEQGRQIHGRTAVSCFGSDVTVNNALIGMYSKCGSLDDAQLVFKKMGKHDAVSCTTMITTLGQHGMGKEAIEILKEMTVEKLTFGYK